MGFPVTRDRLIGAFDTREALGVLVAEQTRHQVFRKAVRERQRGFANSVAEQGARLATLVST